MVGVSEIERLAKEQSKNPSSELNLKAILEVPYFPSSARESRPTLHHVDDDCAVFLWKNEFLGIQVTFRSFSVHPQKGGGVELRPLAEFDVWNVNAIQFKSGVMAVGAAITRKVT